MSDREKQYVAIVGEIARLSAIIFRKEVDTLEQAQAMAFFINHLSAILADRQTISDFHDHISGCPEIQREYYYNLLYLIEK